MGGQGWGEGEGQGWGEGEGEGQGWGEGEGEGEGWGEGWGEGEGEGEGLTLPLPPTICTRRTWSSAHAKMSTTCPAVTARLATAW